MTLTVVLTPQERPRTVRAHHVSGRWPWQRFATAALMATAALAGCGTEEGPERGPDMPEGSLRPVVTDSAGVRIVEYTTLEGFPLGAWRAAGEEAVRVGTTGDHDAESPSSFGLAIAVDRQADGSILAPAISPSSSSGRSPAARPAPRGIGSTGRHRGLESSRCSKRRGVTPCRSAFIPTLLPLRSTST